MAVYRLNEELWFPYPYKGEADGLIAVGGDLSPERLLLAYSNGIFPWFSFTFWDEPHWYCPLDRFVIFPEELHISHSLRQLLRQKKYELTFNKDFDGVINGCSTADGRNKEEGAWLGADMIKAYTELNKMGFAFSVEVWQKEENTSPKKEISSKKNRKLVGGLYGIFLKNAFFGESMFSLVPNASKLALVHLADILIKVGGRFIDCQFKTPHLKSMGGRHITYEEYMNILNEESTNYSHPADSLS